MRKESKEKTQFNSLPPNLRQAVEVAAGIIRRIAARGLDIPRKDGLISGSTNTCEDYNNDDKKN